MIWFNASSLMLTLYFPNPYSELCKACRIIFFMLPKENRITKNAEFSKIYKKGEFFKTKLIHFKYFKTNLPQTRVGFVIGLKVSKSAVKRNQLKRWMREVFRLNLDKIKSGFDIAVIAKPGAIDMKHKDVERDIMFFLKKVKLM